MKRFLLGLISFFILSMANATPVTVGFKPTVSMASSCTISVGSLPFGTVVPNPTTSTFGTATISLQCSNKLPYTITISKSPLYADEVNVATKWSINGWTRKMLSASGGVLYYNVFQDANHTLGWGGENLAWNSSQFKKTGTGTGLLQSILIYGAVDNNQYPQPGSYSDTLPVNVYF